MERSASRTAGLRMSDWLGRITEAVALRRQRRALARLDRRLLDDVGIDHDTARAEAARPLWDVPQTWLR